MGLTVKIKSEKERNVMEEIQGKYKVELLPDESPENPCKEWDMLSKFVIFHRNYDFGNCKDFSDAESFKEHMEAYPDDHYWPLYMFDHSGIAISLTPFGCRWDSGQVGWVWISEEQAVKEFGKEYTKEQLDKIVEAETKTLDDYIRGEVYGYRITDTETEEEMDSCWGFYGREYAEQEAQASVDYFLKEDAEKVEKEKLRIAVEKKRKAEKDFWRRDMLDILEGEAARVIERVHLCVQASDKDRARKDAALKRSLLDIRETAADFRRGYPVKQETGKE